MHLFRTAVRGSIDGLDFVPVGAAFGALSLGFLGEGDTETIYESGSWTRLTTKRGHMPVKRRAWMLTRWPAGRPDRRPLLTCRHRGRLSADSWHLDGAIRGLRNIYPFDVLLLQRGVFGSSRAGRHRLKTPPWSKGAP